MSLPPANWAAEAVSDNQHRFMFLTSVWKCVYVCNLLWLQDIHSGNLAWRRQLCHISEPELWYPVKQWPKCINVITKSNPDTRCQCFQPVITWVSLFPKGCVLEVMDRVVLGQERWNVFRLAFLSAVGLLIILDSKQVSVSSWNGAMHTTPVILLLCVRVCGRVRACVYMCVYLCGCMALSMPSEIDDMINDSS